MLNTFLSQVRDQVSRNIIKTVGQSNLIEEAMLYSASADSKMIRAALIFASGKINLDRFTPLSASINGTIRFTVTPREDVIYTPENIILNFDNTTVKAIKVFDKFIWIFIY